MCIRDSTQVKRWLNQQIADIDELISEQINAVLHNDRFQELESSWRGLWFLVDAGMASDNVKIRLLDLSWKDLSKDMERAPDFDQSGLFHLIYNEEFGTPVANPLWFCWAIIMYRIARMKCIDTMTYLLCKALAEWRLPLFAPSYAALHPSYLV